MNDVLEGKWKQLQGAAKTKWGKLTNDDLLEIEGDYDRLVGKLQHRYGWEKHEAKEHARRWIDSL